MKNRIARIILSSSLALVASMAIVPVAAFAQTAADGGVGSSKPTDSGFQIVSCTGVVDPRTGQGVPCDYNQLVATVSRILTYTFYILAPIFLLLIMITGYRYLMAGSDPVKLEGAKKMIKPLLLGLFLVSAAYLIVYKFILGNLLASQVGDLQKSSIIQSGASVQNLGN